MIEIPGILGEIVKKRLVTIEQAKKKRDLQELRTAAENTSTPLSLKKSIESKLGISLIAEMKRSSPSAGSLDPDLDPAHRAALYSNAGAAAISVLTEYDYFSGTIDDLAVVAKIAHASGVAVLRKDFIVDEYQVHEARAAGADCILLIIACLDQQQYADLFALSNSLGMDVIVEVFDEPELDIAMNVDPPIVGINNRNLKTMQTSLSTFEALAQKIPADRVRIAESGMKNSDDVERMGKAGAKAVLVGESLMRAGADVSELTQAMAAVEVG